MNRIRPVLYNNLVAGRLLIFNSSNGESVGNTWITNMLHSLDNNGVLIRKPGPARSLAKYFGSIVEAVTARPKDEEDWVTAIQCRRRPGRVRCVAPIVAGYAEADPNTIVWQCPACGDNGHISGWQETQWDKRASLVTRPLCLML